MISSETCGEDTQEQLSDKEEHVFTEIRPASGLSCQRLIPSFDLRDWRPSHGVEFFSLLSISSLDYVQTEHVCKIKTLSARRCMRRNDLTKTFIGVDKINEQRLHSAASSNDEETVVELLDRGVNPCVCDSRKRTALHIAAAKGNEKIVSILVQRGANPNQKDCIGNTPLHLAVCSNNVPVVSVLLAAGTNALSLDNAGRTPMHLAQSRINVLQGELRSGHTAYKIKSEVLQVADMMNKYLRVRGDEHGVEQLTKLCQQLQVSNTTDELSSVNDLLEQFTCLTLQKPTLTNS